MSGTMAILNRELVARRDLLLVAAAATGIALLMPLMPGLEGYRADDVREISSSVLALTIGWAMAIGLGASVIGSDLSQGRLGFFFSRPVSGLSVWLGRMGAVLVLVYLCEFLVLIPAIVGGGSSLGDFSSEDGKVALAAFIVAPLLLVLLSHAVSIMFRARTAWLFLDLAGLVAVGVAAWLSIRPYIFLSFAKVALFALTGTLVGAAIVALAAAGAVGVIVGRTDLRRSHGALSLTLWSVLGLSVGATATYATWLRSFEPADLDRVEVLSVDPTGNWMEVEGSAPGHLDVQRRFLISAYDARWVVLPTGRQWYFDGLSFSGNGLRAVWLGPGVGEEPRSVQYADLGESRPEVVSTTLMIPPGTHVDLSSDGNLLAMVDDRTLSVYELAGERLVSAVRLPDDLSVATIFFLDPDTIRLYAKHQGAGSSSIRIAEISVSTGGLTKLGSIEVVSNDFWIIFDEGLERMVVATRIDLVERQSSVRTLHNARNGDLIGELGQNFPHFLADGRLVVMGKDDENFLRIREILPVERVVVNPEIRMSEAFHVGGEVLPGQVAFSRETGFDGPRRVMRTEVVDVDSGAVRPIGDDLRVATRGWRWKDGDLGAVFWYTTGFEGARILTRGDGAVLRWDPESGELVHIVGGAK